MNKTIAGYVILFIICFFILCIGLWGCPKYTVYTSRMEGEAKLAHAQFEREVQVKDAEGKLEASKSLALMDVERAKGVAKANQIIGESLKNNDDYLKWLYIEALKEKQGTEVIYVPTEAGMPILEAGRRGARGRN